MSKILVVIKREFLKSIKKPSFWILTFGFPLIYVVIFGISFFSSVQTQKNIDEQNNSIKNIFVYDESGLLNGIGLEDKVTVVDSYQKGYDDFLGKPQNIFTYYKENFPSTKEIELYINSKNLVDDYSSLVDKITKQGILENISQKDLALLYASNFHIKTNKFENGKPVEDGSKKMIIGGIGAVIYFIMIVFGNSLMLSSVVQEKENRTIEIILSTIRTKQFIIGKILGGLLVLLFQLSVIFVIPLLILVSLPTNISPINISAFISNISFLDWIIMLFYIIGGFLIFSGLMVAAGSAGSNQKEAGSFSGPIILLSVLPLYLSSMLMSAPQSDLALFFSYFPLTSPMVLLFRTSIGELHSFEYILGPISVIFYILLSFWLATKVFEMGALEFNKKISLKHWFKK